MVLRPTDDEFMRRIRLDADSLAQSRAARRREGRSLFSDEAGLPELRPSFIVYLDELGTSARLARYGDDELRADLEMYDRLRAFIHNERMHDGDTQRTLYFSDNLVVAAPIEPFVGIAADFGLFFQVFSVASYQLNLAIGGRFLRGGVAAGMAYADDTFVTGPGHLAAVRLEESVAVMPRVVLDETTAALAQCEVDESGASQSVYSEYLLRDIDGEIFINYLQAAFEDEGLEKSPSPRSGFEAHRDRINEALGAPHDGPIRSKYGWLAAYHNYALESSPLRHEQTLRISDAPARGFKPFA